MMRTHFFQTYSDPYVTTGRTHNTSFQNVHFQEASSCTKFLRFVFLKEHALKAEKLLEPENMLMLMSLYRDDGVLFSTKH